MADRGVAPGVGAGAQCSERVPAGNIDAEEVPTQKR
jgi:hypothetical protein